MPHQNQKVADVFLRSHHLLVPNSPESYDQRQSIPIFPALTSLRVAQKTSTPRVVKWQTLFPADAAGAALALAAAKRILLHRGFGFTLGYCLSVISGTS